MAKMVKAKKKSAKKPAPPEKTGMWKVLELKTKQRLEAEKEKNESRPQYGTGSSFQPNARDPRFTKFAGPRRKVG